MKPFTISKESQGKWLDLGNLRQDGTNIKVKFEGGKMIVVKTIPDNVLNAIYNEARHSADIWKKCKLLGKTQQHWLPIASLPAAVNAKWEEELGPERHNPEAWKRRYNDPQYRKFRTSEYRV